MARSSPLLDSLVESCYLGVAALATTSDEADRVFPILAPVAMPFRSREGREGEEGASMSLPMSLSMPMPNGPRAVGPADLWEIM